MRILHVINSMSAGGAELHLLTLCRHHKHAGLDIAVACLREGIRGSRSLGPEFEAEGIPVIRLRADARFDVRFPLRLARVVRDLRPDILHTHLPRADLAGVLVRRVFPSLPLVCTVHNIYRRQSWSGARLLPVFSYVWRQADVVIAISKAVRTWLIAKRRIPAAKISVIYYGIDADRFARPAVDFRTQWQLGHRPIVGTIGRIVPHKGQETLVRAMPAVLQEAPEACLVIAGYDLWGYGRQLQVLLDALDLGDHVRFVGFQEDVASLLHAFDVFAFSTTSEGFGQVVVEAMASQRPVVASRIAPLTEIVTDGETGLLADQADPAAFADAVVSLLSDPQRAARMGILGRERVIRHFNATRMAAETLAVYRKLLL